MSDLTVARAMGERAAIHGLDSEKIAAVVALGCTDSDWFENWYQAFDQGREQGRDILNAFLMTYKQT